MNAQRRTLTAEQIVDAARTAIDEDGLASLSMRRLGARLGVDPMAIYHHVDNKQTLLSLVVERVMSELPALDSAAPWDDRVRSWATSYWRLVRANRDVVAAALADSFIARGGVSVTQPLVDALAVSGIDQARVEPAAYLVVDAVHGSALSGVGDDDVGDGQLMTWFEAGLEIIVAGIAVSTRPTD